MTCLQDTYWFLYSDNERANNFNIIHALVERKSDRMIHPHAVVYNKITGDIHEVSNSFKNKNVVLPFRIWIAMGNVTKVKQYTMSEYTSLLKKHNRWDFFHLDLNK